MSNPTLDRLGRAFDPAKFIQRFDSLGRWINAKAGRKSRKPKPARPLPMNTTAETPATPTPAPQPGETFGEAYALPTETAPATPAANPAPAAPPDFSDILKAAGTPAPAAAGASDLSGEGEDSPTDNSTAETIIGIIQTALVLIGDDEGVLSAQEKRMLRPPLERVLKKYDIGAAMLPAEVDLALAMATILIVRLQKPKTATWVAKVKMWFGVRAAEVKGEALAKRIEKANT